MPESDTPVEAHDFVRRLAALPERKRREIERFLLLRSAADDRVLDLLRRYSNGELTSAELEESLEAPG
jgi:hypothetical protein